MAKWPYITFFVDDWLSDEKLRLCSLEARGLWIDMLCLMHKCDRRGYLQQASGKPFTLDQIARIAGCSTDSVSRLLQELTDSGAASATEHGVIFNRRMTRDEDKRLKRAAAGQKGGEATQRLLKQKVKQTSSNSLSKESSNPMDYGDGSDSERGKEGGVGETIGEKAGELSRLWCFRCTRRTRFGHPADLEEQMDPRFAELLRHVAYEAVKAEIERPDRNLNEQFFHLEARLMPKAGKAKKQGPADFVDRLMGKPA